LHHLECTASPIPIEDFDSFHLFTKLDANISLIPSLTKRNYFLSTMLLAGDDIDYRSVVGKTGGNSVPKSGKSLKPTY